MVRLPAPLLQETNLAVGQLIEITVENGKIVIAPIRNRFRLEDLLAGVTPENKHAEIDFGQSVCRETL